MPKATVKTKLVVRQDRKVLREGPEISVFLVCLGLVNELRTLKGQSQDGKLSRAAFLERCNAVVAQFTDTVEATERFDIVLPVMEFGQFSPFFWSWFNWWEDYFKAMSPRQISHIERLGRERVPALDERRPQGHWIRCRQKPAFTMVAW
jgi:hypothetical protein